MPVPRLVPLPGRPVLLVDTPRRNDRYLVAADLHLGLGALDRWAEGPPEAAPMRMAELLLGAADETGVRRLIFAGDVKHTIVGASSPLRRVIFDFFGELLAGGLSPEVVLGNHDVGLSPALPREVPVHPSTGLAAHGVGIFHGHRWPSEQVLAQPLLVAGHLHPGFRFAPSSDDPGAKRRCWIRSTFAPRPRRKVRGRPWRRFRARELVVLPAFHPLAGTESLNRARPTRGRSFLFGRFLTWGTGRLYLLDGTDLGPLRIPPPRTRPQASPAAGPAR